MTKKNDNNKDIIKFPTLAERDRIRKKQNKEKEWRKEYKKKNHEPFFKFGNIPPFTGAMTAILIFIHVVLNFALPYELRGQALETFAFTPAKIIGDFSLTTLLTPITYTLFHGDWMHLGFNAIMLLALGTFTERMFSTPTTIKFFALSTIGGALAYFILNPTTPTPVIGASGAINGLFAAVLMMLHEQGRIPNPSQKNSLKGAWKIIGIWAGISLLFGLMGGGIAWQAHLGGLLTGATLYTLMRKRKLRL
ncbi:MAG: rhomboid family intramembrane serine protease [Alphaproteobacteria bacterium]